MQRVMKAQKKSRDKYFNPYPASVEYMVSS